MSFICDRCKRVQPGKTKPIRVVAEVRPKVYPPRHKDGYQFDPGGVGEEIAREEELCARCAARGKGKFIIPK